MPCPKMEAGKTCPDCAELADKPDGYKECDNRVSDFYEEKAIDAIMLQKEDSKEIGIQH